MRAVRVLMVHSSLACVEDFVVPSGSRLCMCVYVSLCYVTSHFSKSSKLILNADRPIHHPQ